MKEGDILKFIHLAMSKLKVTVFRSNTGQAWTGKVLEKTVRKVVILDPRVLHAGLCNGSSDLIGWQSVTVTPEMVGKKVAIFTAIEVKGADGRLTPDQRGFIDRIKADGGCAFMARSDQDAVNEVRLWRIQMGIPE